MAEVPRYVHTVRTATKHADSDVSDATLLAFMATLLLAYLRVSTGRTGTMADQPAPAAPDAAAGPSGSLLAQLRTLSTTPVADLRQQAGGPAGVVEMLAGLAASSFGKGGGAPPFPVPASSSSASSASDANAAVAAGDAGAGTNAGQNPNAVASPQREEALLYLQTLTVHGSNLVGCIDSGIKLEAVATCVKVCSLFEYMQLCFVVWCTT